MPYCENCGQQINPNAKFCGNCGAARTQSATNKPIVNNPVNTQLPQPKRERLSYYSPPSTSQPSAPVPIMQAQSPIMQAPMAQAPPRMQLQPSPTTSQDSGETTIGVILFRKPKSLGRWDTYTGVVTSQRLIFAQMTNEMLKIAVMQSRNQAKAEGKGFFGQWSEQLKATWRYSQRYLTMQPQTILAETPGNFELYNTTISEIKVKLKGERERENRYLEVKFHSTMGKFDYHIDENSDVTNLLKRVYGDRVKMPFGYFSKSININF